MWLLKAPEFVLVAWTRKPPFRKRTFFFFCYHWIRKNSLKKATALLLVTTKQSPSGEKKDFLGFYGCSHLHCHQFVGGGAARSFPAARSPTIKCVGINLTKELKHLFYETFKLMKKEIETLKNGNTSSFHVLIKSFCENDHFLWKIYTFNGIQI